MSVYFQDNEVEECIEDIIESNYSIELKNIQNTYPDKRSLNILFSHIDDKNPELGMFALNHPDTFMSCGTKVLKKLLATGDLQFSDFDVSVRIKELPKDTYVNIRDIRSKHLNKLIAIEGLVRKATEVRPKMKYAHFTCERCNTEQWIAQNNMLFTEPIICENREGSCNKGGTRFRLDDKQSIYIDTQKIEVQEAPEGLRGGSQPEKIVGFLEHDLSGCITPGNRVVLNGVVRSMPKNPANREKTTVFDKYFEVISYDFEQFEYEEVKISEEDEKELIEMSKDHDIMEKIVKSISPSIFGLEIEKEAIALQLFGGCHKEMDDGTTMRGDIHILLIGDPGVAKSQILRYMSKLTPRGIFASGKSASSAGLTVSAVKDDFGDGRWTLEAGALVIADGGLACIDELDKMGKEDRSSLHEAMESQKISVAKAGITATLQCRCSMLAAANPKHGRFEMQANITDQIDLPPALMSRFDLIFVLTDVPNQKQDSDISSHILMSHRRGEARRKISKEGYDERFGEVLENSSKVVPIYSAETLRKYVAYAKKITPLMSDAAIDLIKDNYLKIRKIGEGMGKAIPITARQLEAYIRLAEASARAHLRDEVIEDDARNAIRIVTYYLEKIVSTDDGGLDIGRIMTGTSQKERDMMHIVKDVLSRESVSFGSRVPYDVIIKLCEEEGLSSVDTDKCLKKMDKKGEVFSPIEGCYTIVK